jgi:hypothetical protein
MKLDSLDDRIECPHCGHEFYYELNRCPSCRRSVYHPEGDRPDEVGAADGIDPLLPVPGQALLQQLRPAIGVAIGALLTVVIGGLFFAGLSRLLGEFAQPWALMAAPIAVFASAYAATLYTEQHVRGVGLAVGLFGLPLLYVLTLSDPDTGGSSAALAIVGALNLVAGYWAGVIVERQQVDSLTRQLFSLPDETELYDSLLQKLGNDVDRAERLIEYERQFALNGTRATLIMNAISRWERDNR